MKQILRNSRWGFWTAVGRPAGHMAKEPLASVDRSGRLPAILKRNIERPVDRAGRPTKPESWGLVVG